MQKGEYDLPVRIYGADNCRGECDFAPMQCINIHCKIHGIPSSVSHPGMKHLAVYRRDDETRVCKKPLFVIAFL